MSQNLCGSSVDTWLASLPDSFKWSSAISQHKSSYTTQHCQTAVAEEELLEKLTSRKRRRVVLKDMDVNASPTPRRSSRTKKMKISKSVAADARTLSYGTDSEVEEILATPRATQIVTGYRPQASDIRSSASSSSTSSIIHEDRFGLQTGPRADAVSSRSLNFESRSQASQSSRAKSPIKSQMDLRFGEVEIHIASAEAYSLPADVETLHQRLEYIKAGSEFIPLAAKTLIMQDYKTAVLLPFFFMNGSEASDSDIYQEFLELQEIRDIIVSDDFTDASEAAFNDEVHSRLFRLALRTFPSVQHYNVTSARACAAFQPRHSSGMIFRKKLVDYTLNLKGPLQPSAPAKGTEMQQRSLETSRYDDRAIALLRKQPQDMQTLTQSLYTPTRLRPCAVSIETKSHRGLVKDAELQLASWAAAHFRRLRTLLPPRRLDSSSIRLPTHPCLIMTPRELTVLYAFECNSGNKVVLSPGPTFSAPSSIVEGYRCLAALRTFAEWSEGDSVRGWWEKEIFAPGTMSMED